jgi:hypothetical protein
MVVFFQGVRQREQPVDKGVEAKDVLALQPPAIQSPRQADLVL